MDALDSQARDIDRRLSQQQREALLDYPNVIGTGVGLRQVGNQYQTDCAIIVYVTDKLPETDIEAQAIVPETIECSGEDVPTDVQLARHFRANTGSPLRGEAIRPMPGGVEVGAAGESGTATALFHTRDGEPRILTARHSITTSTSSPVGVSVYQPESGESIGTVVDSHRFSTAGTRTNRLDTVLVEPDDEDAITGAYLGWQEAVGTERPTIGDHVIVFSATAGVETGLVSARDVSATLDMPNGTAADFRGLVEYDVSPTDGSSGAAVGQLDPETRQLTIAGQHIGGTSSSSLMAPWTTIEREFGELFPAAHDGSQQAPEIRDPDPDPDPDPGPSPGTSLTIVVEDETGDPVEGALVELDEDLDTTGTIRIRVEDEDGSRVEGALVELESS